VMSCSNQQSPHDTANELNQSNQLVRAGVRSCGS
jgi:hypothetical protein